jgi:hypothetical protein
VVAILEVAVILEDIMADTAVTIAVVCMLHFVDTMVEDPMDGVITHFIGGVQ